MMTDQIDDFLDKIISLTDEGAKKWVAINACGRDSQICEKIVSSNNWDKNYVIDKNESYVFYVNEGFIALVSAVYGNAKVFSPTFDKRFLAACIGPGVDVEVLSDQGDFGQKVETLFQCILDNDRLTMPDALYDFLEKAVEKDGDDISR